MAPLDGLQQDLVGRLVREGLHPADALDLELMSPQHRAEIDEALGPVHHEQPPPVLEQGLSRGGHVVQRAGDFVAGESQRAVGVHPALALGHVGWIGHDHVVGPTDEGGARLVSDVPLVDVDHLLEVIHRDGARRHVGHRWLDFNGVDGLGVGAAVEQQRQHAGARADVEGAGLAVDRRRGVPREQHRIDIEAEGVRVLKDVKAVQAQVLETLARLLIRARKISRHVGSPSVHLQMFNLLINCDRISAVFQKLSTILWKILGIGLSPPKIRRRFVDNFSTACGKSDGGWGQIDRFIHKKPQP